MSSSLTKLTHFVTVGVRVQCLPLWQNEHTSSSLESRFNVFLSDKMNTLRHRWSPGSMSSSLSSSSLQGGDLSSRGIQCNVLPVGKTNSAEFIKTNLFFKCPFKCKSSVCLQRTVSLTAAWTQTQRPPEQSHNYTISSCLPPLCSLAYDLKTGRLLGHALSSTRACETPLCSMSDTSLLNEFYPWWRQI